MRSRSSPIRSASSREPLGQDRPRAVQRGLRIGHALVGVHERGGRRERIHRRVAEQPLGERLQAGLARDLRLGAPLGLERQVDVLQARLGLGAPDLRLQLLVQLALLAHRLQDRRPPLLQLPQIAQPLLERAQLRVVEHLGRFLAVAGDEGHGRTAVEQFHGGLHLPLRVRRVPRRSCLRWTSSTVPRLRLLVAAVTLRLRGTCARLARQPGHRAAVSAAGLSRRPAAAERVRRRAGPAPGRAASRRWRWRQPIWRSTSAIARNM